MHDVNRLEQARKTTSWVLSADLLILERVAEDVVHVLVKPLQAAVAGPHIGVVGGHQALHRGLQAGQQLPVFSPCGDSRVVGRGREKVWVLARLCNAYD